ncbi:MAG: glycoside hydrolase [Clostridia bacterium]|nr:glycoside hydrolase [Clostridia bacterium]
MKINLLENEVWYGLAVEDGDKMPLDASKSYSRNLQPVNTNNQYSPLLLSSKGRYIWGDDGFNLTLADGVLTVESSLAEVKLYEGYENLRGAFRTAAKAHFPADGKLPPEEFFSKPQYNTWIELLYEQNQHDITEYCRHIVEHNMPKGVIMIDDMWCDYYGYWDFNRRKFPDPKGMMDLLHQWGFKVMVWICPFISPDSKEFRLLRDRGGLVRTQDGKVRMVEWWDGISAVLDLSNPVDQQWFREQCDFLTETYGVDGFKFDAGDAYFYRMDDKTFGNVTPNQQCELWAQVGLNYPYNEYRACCKNAGRPLVQRLQDKGHRWTGTGVNQLLPHMLAQGILGYAFGCPDMVGGGQFADFLPGAVNFEQELFVRYCAAAALMPMIQFSAAPWRVLDDEHYAMILKLMEVRERFLPEILRLVREAAFTGEPAVRYMEYVFPGQGLERVTDQFMLGDDILVAPVLTKGARSRSVILPAGRWKRDVGGELLEGGRTVTVDAALDELPVFVRA